MLFIIGDKVNLTGHARSGYNFNKTRFTDQKKVEMFMDKNQGQGKKKFFFVKHQCSQIFKDTTPVSLMAGSLHRNLLTTS